MRRRGVTLVEALVATMLTTILIGIIVAVAGQVQSAVSLSSARLVACEQVRALVDDMARDLGRIVPQAEGAPAPFANEPPIALERVPVGQQEGDQGDLGRCADSLQLFATVSDPSKRAAARAVLSYSMDLAGTAVPALVKPPGGGPAAGRIRRHLLKLAGLGDSTTRNELAPHAAPVLVENVLSFQLDYLDGRARERASGRSPDVFLIPDDRTKSGSAFLVSGNVTLDCGRDGPRAVSADDSFSPFLPLVPIGQPLFLELRKGAPLQPFLVRGRAVAAAGRGCVLLGDRPIAAPGDVLARAFLPPAAIRVTVTVLFGKGPENQTARFVRVIPVPR